MGFARSAGVPVCLIGDIDRGGVIASLVGTHAVLDKEDAAMVRSFIVNKFRGDPRLFDNGIRAIETRTGWPCRGLIPWLRDAARLPAEDAVVLESQTTESSSAALKIAAPMLSRLANFDDADPLVQEEGVDFSWVTPGQPIPRDADVIILFGTKSTLGDLAFLRDQGWHHDILAHARNGGRVLGICGGFQMLGDTITDPTGSDGAADCARGLGLLNIDTVMSEEKTVALRAARCAQTGSHLEAYEIHVGESYGADCERPMAAIDDRKDGARSPCGRIEGSYLHGLFVSDSFRHAWLTRAGAKRQSTENYAARVDRALDQIAESVAAHTDVERLFSDALPIGWQP